MIELLYRFLRGAFAALLFVAPGQVAAQGVVDDAAPLGGLPTQVVPIHTGPADDGQAYGTWAAGENYKISFHDGACFVPYLGSGYPRTQSLRWRTRSARVGGVELCDGQAPRACFTERRAEFDLGGIVEAYDVQLGGVEQTFVLAAPVAGSAGDLVIEGAVETALHGVVGSTVAHQEIRFIDDTGNAILSYGAVTAVDAAGRTCAMTTAIEGGDVTLRLDGEWLAAAEYPVVVDPIIGTLYSFVGLLLLDVEVVRQPWGGAGEIWHANTRAVSANDSDLWVSRINDDGSGTGHVYMDLSNLWSTSDVSIGLHAAADCALIAFSRHFHNSDERRIRFHKHDAANLNQTTSYNSVAGPVQGWRPSVGSDLSPAGEPYLLIAYQGEGGPTFYETTTSSIEGVVVDLTTPSGAAGAPFVILDGSFEENERPAVGTVGSSGGQYWPVACQTIGNHALFSPHVDWDVELRRVDRFGNVAGDTVVGLNNGMHEQAPMLAGEGDPQMLLCTLADSANVGNRPSSVAGGQLRTQRLRWSGQTFVGYPHVGYFGGTPGAIMVPTGFAMDTDTRSHYVATWWSTLSNNAFMASFGYRGDYLHTEGLLATGNGHVSGPGAVTYDGQNGRFLCVASSNDFAAGSIAAKVYEHPGYAPAWQTGPGCGGGQLSWHGSQLIGDEDCVLRLSGLDPGALGAVFVATQVFHSPLAGLPFVEPSCVLLVPNTGPGFVTTLPIGFGPEIDYDIDLPEWLEPINFRFQGFHFDGSMSTVYATERLTVQLVK